MISQNLKEYILEHPELQDYLEEDDTSDTFFVEKEKAAKQLTPDEILTMMVLLKIGYKTCLGECEAEKIELEEAMADLEEQLEEKEKEIEKLYEQP